VRGGGGRRPELQFFWYSEICSCFGHNISLANVEKLIECGFKLGLDGFFAEIRLFFYKNLERKIEENFETFGRKFGVMAKKIYFSVWKHC
jgi:hypothetical protein